MSGQYLQQWPYQPCLENNCVILLWWNCWWNKTRRQISSVARTPVIRFRGWSDLRCVSQEGFYIYSMAKYLGTNPVTSVSLFTKPKTRIPLAVIVDFGSLEQLHSKYITNVTIDVQLWLSRWHRCSVCDCCANVCIYKRKDYPQFKLWLVCQVSEKN